MKCQWSFNDFIAQCPDGTIRLFVYNVNSGETVYWRLTDKFGKVYTGSSGVDDWGEVILDITDLPPGLLTKYSGTFVLELSYDQNFCTTIQMLMARHYDAIVFDVQDTGQTKDDMGCPVPIP